MVDLERPGFSAACVEVSFVIMKRKLVKYIMNERMDVYLLERPRVKDFENPEIMTISTSF